MSDKTECCCCDEDNRMPCSCDKYFTAVRKTAAERDSLVNHLLQHDWALYGGPYTLNGRHAQVMTRGACVQRQG
jgi:hypothetical protein